MICAGTALGSARGSTARDDGGADAAPKFLIFAHHKYVTAYKQRRESLHELNHVAGPAYAEGSTSSDKWWDMSMARCRVEAYTDSDPSQCLLRMCAGAGT